MTPKAPGVGVRLARSRLREYSFTYGAIAAAVIVATLIRLAVAPLVGPALPFVTYFIVVLWLAWYKGFWPAAFGTAISGWAGARFVLTKDAPGILTSGHSEWATILGFVLTSLAVSFLIDFQRRTLLRAKAAERAQATVAAENARLLKQAELAAEQLLQINDQLRRANGDLELFAYSASHDLQEPLRTISLSAQFMARSAPRPAEGPDFVRQILTAARRMESLMQDILTYISTAKLESEAVPMIDPGLVLSGVLEQMKVSIAESGAVITSSNLPTIAMHENRLGQVFQNLIGNAIKYRNAELPRIHIDAARHENSWVFSVSDNGMGIDAKFNQQIFGLFKRLHTQSEYEGSGIGLSICQRIVERYGGRIWIAQSELGKGSTFCFSVPIK